MDERLQKILELAVYAPSGENCQPWKFNIRENQVEVWNIPERDNSLYNWGQRPSYVAHGALIENIAVASPVFGLIPHIIIFPNSTNLDYVAHITFEATTPNTHPLYSYIKQRVTNRKAYKKISLTSRQKQELTQLSQNIEHGRIIFTEDSEKKKVLALAAAGNERILFENPTMHKFFYDHITWTEQEDKEKKIGFYIKTFELPPSAEKMFKLARKSGFVRFANKLGFSKMIVKQNAKVYASCSAMGIIAMPTNSPEDFLLAGRIFQRLWLTLTKMGLSLQPLTGILFLMQRIIANEANQLIPSHQKFIKEQYQQIKNSFGITNETIAMMFRIGSGGVPTAHSLRLAPQITTKE